MPGDVNASESAPHQPLAGLGVLRPSEIPRGVEGSGSLRTLVRERVSFASAVFKKSKQGHLQRGSVLAIMQMKTSIWGLQSAGSWALRLSH